MDSIIKNAIKGQSKAILKLYENNKEKAMFVAKSLLLDEEKATEAVSKIFMSIWNDMKTSHVEKEADFTNLVIRKTADYCKQVTAKKNSKAYKIPADKNFVISSVSIKKEENDSIETYVLATLPELHRFIFVLHTVLKVEKDVIKNLLKIDKDILNHVLDAERENVEKIIAGSKSDASSSYESIAEKLRKKETSISVPEKIDSEVKKFAQAAEKPYKENKRKKMIFGGLATVAVCAVVGIGVFFATRPDDNGNANGSGTGTGTNTNTTQNTTSQNTGNLTSSDKNENSTTNNNTQVDSSVVTKPLIELDKSVDYYATIDIADYGTIKVKLNQEVAPVTVSNFVSLAQKGFYDGLTFHRIMEDFMMQGGAPDGDGTKGAGYNIVGEFTSNDHENNLSHTRGAISMARSTAYNSASSQFFICHEDSLWLDGDYAVFGYVTEGMDVVDAVCEKSKPTDNNGTIKPEEQPVITSVKITTVAK